MFLALQLMTLKASAAPVRWLWKLGPVQRKLLCWHHLHYQTLHQPQLQACRQCFH